MIGWKPIEKKHLDKPIWVLKYDVFFYPKGHALEGNFCAPDTPGAQKFTDCHGWYEDEETALKVQRHFPNPQGYRLEKVYKGTVE